MKASIFVLIFGFLTCFALWCPQPSLLFVKELGKPVINGQAEPAPTSNEPKDPKDDIKKEAKIQWLD